MLELIAEGRFLEGLFYRLNTIVLRTIDGHDFLVKVASTPANDEAYHLMNVVGSPSLPDVMVIRMFTRAIAALAKRVTRAGEAITA